MELSSAPRLPPDLSLHISPPSSSPIFSTNPRRDIAIPLDVWRQTTAKSSPVSHPHSCTDLSLARPHSHPQPAASMDLDTPWKRGSMSGNSVDDEACLKQLPIHRHSSADSLRRIKGIPVYHNRSFPFLSVDHSREKDSVPNPKLGFYQPPFPPCWSSSSSSSSLLTGGCFDVPMGLLHSTGTATPAAYRASRFGDWATDSSCLKSQQQQQAQFGIGASDGGGRMG